MALKIEIKLLIRYMQFLLYCYICKLNSKSYTIFFRNFCIDIYTLNDRIWCNPRQLKCNVKCPELFDLVRKMKIPVSVWLLCVLFFSWTPLCMRIHCSRSNKMWCYVGFGIDPLAVISLSYITCFDGSNKIYKAMRRILEKYFYIDIPEEDTLFAYQVSTGYRRT